MGSAWLPGQAEKRQMVFRWPSLELPGVTVVFLLAAANIIRLLEAESGCGSRVPSPEFPATPLQPYQKITTGGRMVSFFLQ